jgi:hypothetical protein
LLVEQHEGRIAATCTCTSTQSFYTNTGNIAGAHFFIKLYIFIAVQAVQLVIPFVPSSLAQLSLGAACCAVVPILCIGVVCCVWVMQPPLLILHPDDTLAFTPADNCLR